MDHKKCAAEILKNIGGKENLVSAAHCATRLRLVIGDNSKVSKAKLENTDGVKGVFEAAGQLQIIIGTGTVNKVFDEFAALSGVSAASKEDVKAAAASKAPWYKRTIKTLGDIFVPIIPAIVATGLLNGLLGGLAKVYPGITGSEIYVLLNIFSNTALTFLPILIAISTARIFGGNIFLGAVIGMIMIHPDLVNAWSVASGAETQTLWNWFGLWNIQNVGYQGHVIPVVLAVILMSVIEKKLHKVVPEMFDLFVTPFVSVLVAGFAALTIIGPVFSQIETWVLTGAQLLITIPYGIGSFIMGGIYSPTVVAGVHHMYSAIEMMMIAENGKSIWMPIATAANVAQGGAALAVAFKTRNQKMRSLALPSSLSAFMGITEPAIFGVNLRYGRPFAAGMLGAACGAAVASVTGVYATSLGVTGLFGFLITTECFWGYLLTCLVSAGVAFAATCIMGIKEEAPTEEAPETGAEAVTEAAATEEVGENTVYSPIEGKAIALSEVPDETFASGVLGEGAAVEPEGNTVYAPADGEVSMLFDTKHAIGITMANGAELLIHIGINTVDLGGEGFTAYVNTGDKIVKGQKLISFDKDFITKKGYKLTTPIIVTNADEFKAVKQTARENVNNKDELLKIEVN